MAKKGSRPVKRSRPRAPAPTPVRTPPGFPAERQFVINESTVRAVLEYIQKVPSGGLPGGNLIQLFAGLQQLPELSFDGQAFRLKEQPQAPQLGVVPPPAPAEEDDDEAAE